MKKFFFDCGTRDMTASFGLLVLRVSIGLMMLAGHGWGKLQNYEKYKAAFPVPDFFPLNLMSPQIAMIATIGAEVGAAALLILGLATRPAAFVLAFTMVVAAFHVHASDPWFLGADVVKAKELALLYLVPVIVILLTGAGSLSLDSAILKDKRRRW